MGSVPVWIAAGLAAIGVCRLLYDRLLLSRAKHPSLQGHARLSKLIARLVPFYEYDEDRFFDSDGAPSAVARQRRSAFDRLAQLFHTRAPKTLALSERIEPGISDLQFTKNYRVPFQYRRYVAERLKVGSLLQQSSGVMVTDLDGRADYDLTGSYGVNLFGYDFYKECIDAGIALGSGAGAIA